MTDPKPLSTKLARPVPPEFEAMFLAGGWPKVNQLYGKRAAQRYFTALGADRLRVARAAERFGTVDPVSERVRRTGIPDPILAHHQRYGAFPNGEPDARR